MRAGPAAAIERLAGMVPRTGRPKISSTSPEFLRRRSSRSSRNAAAMPRASPSTAPITTLRLGRGDAAAPGAQRVGRAPRFRSEAMREPEVDRLARAEPGSRVPRAGPVAALGAVGPREPGPLEPSTDRLRAGSRCIDGRTCSRAERPSADRIRCRDRDHVGLTLSGDRDLAGNAVTGPRSPRAFAVRPATTSSETSLTFVAASRFGSRVGAWKLEPKSFWSTLDRERATRLPRCISSLGRGTARAPPPVPATHRSG